MRFCPFCANEVADEPAQCPYCGKRLPRRERVTGPAEPARVEPPSIKALGTAETLFAPTLGARGENTPPRAPAPPPPPSAPASRVELAATAFALPAPNTAAPSAPRASAAPPPPASSTASGASDTPAPPPRPAVTTAPPTAVTIPAMPPLIPPPAEPALTPPTASWGDGDGPSLPEIPSDAPPGFFGGVPYLLAVRKARSARAHAIRMLMQQNDIEQRQLEEALRDLGKLARASGRTDPQAAGAMELLATLETRRGEAAAGQSALDTQVQDAEERFAREAAVQNETIGLEQVEVQKLQAELSAKQEELRQLKARVGQQDRLIKQLEKEQAARQAQAAKATDAPEREVATRAAAELGVQASDLRCERDAAQVQADELLGPVAEASALLSQARARLQAAQQQLAVARKQLDGDRRQLEADKRAQGVELTRLDGEIAAQLIAVGAALDADRVADPAFEELYGRLDEHRRTLEERQQRSTFLAAERETYDRTAYRNGALILGGSAGFVALLVLLLAVLL